MKNILKTILITSLLTSCNTSKKITRDIDNTLTHSFYKNHFTGFLVIDAITKDTIYAHNSTKYFTPASNTKIVTLFASLEILPKKIPALKYMFKKDTLYFEGTGDPSLAHPYLQDSTALTFLKKSKNLAYAPNNFTDTPYGPGWAWDDFLQYYAPQRNALPVHGNTIIIKNNTPLEVHPPYFKDSVIVSATGANRKANKNLFYYLPTRTTQVEIPFIAKPKTNIGILEKELNKPIPIVNKMPEGTKNTLYGIVADSLYKRMMHESDNFIAEQLLILSASVLQDTLNSAFSRAYVLENSLKDIRQKPRWVDGSGLSRYNLFSPESMVFVLDKIYTKLSRDRLFTIFPAGGVSGTLKNDFTKAPTPYVYAKSGSLSNNYCLSGYLLTTSGKTLIFSFMNNHFTTTSAEVKGSIQRILDTLRYHY